MTLSLNEVEATAKKAARGAGYPWGLAEEAGKAVRWLCAHDFDGCAALAALLQEIDGTDIADWLPLPGDTGWTAQGTRLCPIATGSAISDRATMIGPDKVRLEEVAQPILLAPFAAMLAQQLERNVTLSVDDVRITTDGKTVSRAGGMFPSHAARACLGAGGEVGAPAPARQRAQPAPSAWSTLNAFAHRTYAPATEESRMKGAGAGTSDND